MLNCFVSSGFLGTAYPELLVGVLLVVGSTCLFNARALKPTDGDSQKHMADENGERQRDALVDEEREPLTGKAAEEREASRMAAEASSLPRNFSGVQFASAPQFNVAPSSRQLHDRDPPSPTARRARREGTVLFRQHRRRPAPPVRTTSGDNVALWVSSTPTRHRPHALRTKTFRHGRIIDDRTCHGAGTLSCSWPCHAPRRLTRARFAVSTGRCMAHVR